MSIVHNTLAALASTIENVDPANRLLALVQTRDALNQIIDRAQQKPAAKAPKGKTKTIKHQTLIAEPAPVQAAPVAKPFKAEIRGGLIVVTWVSKEAYLANKALLGEKVFGFSPVSKEWRASEAWVRKNQPQILAGLGLK